jgi:hypothetical protein
VVSIISKATTSLRCVLVTNSNFCNSGTGGKHYWVLIPEGVICIWYNGHNTGIFVPPYWTAVGCWYQTLQYCSLVLLAPSSTLIWYLVLEVTAGTCALLKQWKYLLGQFAIGGGQPKNFHCFGEKNLPSTCTILVLLFKGLFYTRSSQDLYWSLSHACMWFSCPSSSRIFF